MDGLTSLFSSPLFSKLLAGGTLAAGETGNILEERKRLEYQNMVMDLLRNPGKLAAMAAKIQQPLNSGLTQAVTNQVQGDLASRGLSQAPGIIATTESQALAPYYQHNQDAALDAIFRSLGLPAGTFGQPTNLGPVLSMFAKAPATPTTTPTSGLAYNSPDVSYPIGDPTITPFYGGDSTGGVY